MKLIIENLNKSFDTKHVLRNVNATFERGKIYALLGRNGSGKTTFFNCVSQEMSSDSGRVYFDETGPVSDQDFGYVYAMPMLPEFLTGYEFLNFFVDIHKDKGLDRKDINTYFDQIQFNQEDRYKLIKDYSHGMRNKLQMICILILKPTVLFLDEPLTSFDLVASLEMKNLLMDIKNDCIMILSTHILQIARDICDEVVVLQHGEIQALSNERLHHPDFEAEILEILRDDHEK
ncbi:ABC transporter ATP-binding protein [Erysipelothrix sp. HDW6C]|uniref:ATP-binding cassette domain-containing protein n=1 Tax=Erysipelothrix sp. HDW6C TaxID=2714930 RepID=UPI00140D0340|nr:ABC transporter ATP-binding protein [Erysipelothrix sp. HDW6C]QIK69643.1 ABC transporter ATP-binding protein [Erysipelothrix sp. HDW6C]